jgi:hypothetical protein
LNEQARTIENLESKVEGIGYFLSKLASSVSNIDTIDAPPEVKAKMKEIMMTTLI